jgi:DNA-directed RNA polymerase specialized sigma24 family protein
MEKAMSISGSVTLWIDQLKAGAHEAAQPLWERYFSRLVERARQKLASAPRRAADEEDVALNAFASFCRAVEQKRFPQLNDRDDLWQLLIMLSDRKALDQVQFERRQRRGGGQILDEAALGGDDSIQGPLAEITGPEPTPVLSSQIAEECSRLLGLLDDEELRWLALRKMEGFTVEEIAAQLGCVPRTVKRRLQLIRRIWQEEVRP